MEFWSSFWPIVAKIIPIKDSNYEQNQEYGLWIRISENNLFTIKKEKKEKLKTQIIKNIDDLKTKASMYKNKLSAVTYKTKSIK